MSLATMRWTIFRDSSYCGATYNVASGVTIFFPTHSYGHNGYMYPATANSTAHIYKAVFETVRLCLTAAGLDIALPKLL